MPHAEFIHPKDDGILVDVYITPSAWKTTILGVREDGRLKVAIKAPPEAGKANKALLKLFKGFFGECELAAGAKSRKKTVYVKDVDAETVAETILSHI